MSPTTTQLIHDLIRPGIDLSQAQRAYVAYTEHLQQNPLEAQAVMTLTGLPVYEIPIVDDDAQAHQAEQLERERDQLERDIEGSGYYPTPTVFAGVDFNKAREQRPLSKSDVPEGQLFYDSSLTPAQADLLQKGHDMRLSFGKFGPKGQKGFKSIYEIWLE